MDAKTGTLNEGEPHPIAFDAKAYVARFRMSELLRYQECFLNLALTGNMLGEVCSETLFRYLNGAKVSDRYMLGLAWFIRNCEEQKALDMME